MSEAIRITEQDLAACVAAAEKRGRRRGVEEARKIADGEMEDARERGNQFGEETSRRIRDRIGALAPRDSAPVNYGTCANFWHPGHGHEIHARREAVGDLSAPHADHVNDSGCLNWKPRDSGKED